MLNSFCPTSAKDMPPFNKSKKFKYIHFYLVLGTPLVLREADFQFKSKETADHTAILLMFYFLPNVNYLFIIPTANLFTTHDNVRLTGGISASTELHNVHAENSLFLITLGQNCM
jgi:hypothetical protein